MQRWYFAAVLFLFIAAPCAAQHPADGGQPPYAPRKSQPVSDTKFFLKLRADVYIPSGAAQTGIPEIDAVLADMNVRGIRRLVERPALLKSGAEPSGISRLYVVTTGPQVDMRQFLKRFDAIDAVEYAAPYRTHKLAYNPNDPEYAAQWALSQMQAAEAWDVTKGDSTMAIGIVDTGLDLVHPDLALNVYTNPGEWGTAGELSNNNTDDDGNGYIDDWRGWDFIGTGSIANPRPDNNPLDNFSGHGTGVAGCASASTDNGVGVAAPGFRTKLLPVKVAGDQSDGVEAGYEGIVYAVQTGCRVISCGWELDLEQDPAMREVVDYAFNNGSLIVVAAGNDQMTLELDRRDAVIPRTLHVGGTTKNDGLAFFSNRGALVDVFAPAAGVTVLKNGGATEILDGTSYAAGYAAGVAALVFSVHPGWTPDQAAKQLRVTSKPFNAGRSALVYGMLNAYNAVTMNDNLDDIPGIVMRNVEVDYPSGNAFTAIGQTATVRAWLVNLLAPTSPACSAELRFEDSQVTSPTVTIPIGALGTYDSVQIQFDVTLTKDAVFTQAVIPFELTITDGEYIDFEAGFLRYENIDGWELKYESGSAHSVRAMSAVDENIVWAVIQTGIFNYSIIRTTDGGDTWENVAGEGFPVDYRVRALSAVDANTAFIGTWAEDVIDAAVYRTTNAGANWSRTAVPQITDFINFLHMFNANEGVVVGDRLPSTPNWGIGKTYNAGDRWVIPAQVPTGGNEVGVPNAYGFSGSTGFFGTYNMKLYKTVDMGETWTAVGTPARNSGGISLRNEQHLLARFFFDGTTGADMYALSKDGGQSFSQIEPAPPTPFGFVLLEPNGKKMWIGQNSIIYMSRDDGATWTWERLPQMPVGIWGTAAIVSNGQKTWAFAGGTEIFKRELTFEPYTTSVDRIPAAGAFRVRAFPNPAGPGAPLTLAVTAEQPGAMDCVLYDMYGRRAYTQRFEAGAGETYLTVPVHGLAAGVYYAAVMSGKAVQTVQVTIF